jgi:hypothetical protein
MIPLQSRKTRNVSFGPSANTFAYTRSMTNHVLCEHWFLGFVCLIRVTFFNFNSIDYKNLLHFHYLVTVLEQPRVTGHLVLSKMCGVQFRPLHFVQTETSKARRSGCHILSSGTEFWKQEVVVVFPCKISHSTLDISRLLFVFSYLLWVSLATYGLDWSRCEIELEVCIICNYHVELQYVLSHYGMYHALIQNPSIVTLHKILTTFILYVKIEGF